MTTKIRILPDEYYSDWHPDLLLWRRKGETRKQAEQRLSDALLSDELFYFRGVSE